MYKFMMLTGYQKVKTKYGENYQVMGLLYHNIRNDYVGRQIYTIWVNNDNHPLSKYLKPEFIGKDVYIQFGPNGYIEKCEVK